MQMLIHRMDQTAHISLQLPAISKSGETKSTECALSSLARPASSASVFSRSGIVAVSVSGYLRMPPDLRKGFFRET
jgi:hypothetical protein